MTLQKFRQALLICFMLQIGSAFFSTLYAQAPIVTSEIGFGLGGANYKGELAPNYRFSNNQPALILFYRRDVTNPITLRGAALLSHRIIDDNTISDEDYDLPLPNLRQADIKLSLAELSAVMEYNFLDYYDMKRTVRFSPYFFAGLAGVLYNVKLNTDNPLLEGPLDKPYKTTIGVAIPFGAGIKYALSKHWNLGVEFGARKVITDRLDNLSETDSRAVANHHDKDMYFYNGISLSYTFYRLNCPPPYKATPGILD